MSCLPSTAIGCRLDNDSFRLAVSIRLGLHVCTPHRCRCGSRVVVYGFHPLSYRFSIGRLPRHTALNDIIRRSIQSAGITALLEAAGKYRSDGNRLDGITLLPYARGKSLVWDASCTYTFSPSNMIRSAIHARATANEAESIKWSKYSSPTDRFHFHPIAVETSGVFGESTLVFLLSLGSRIASAKGDVREHTWLIQRISFAIVRGNAMSIAMSCRRTFLSQSDDYFCVSKTE